MPPYFSERRCGDGFLPSARAAACSAARRHIVDEVDIYFCCCCTTSVLLADVNLTSLWAGDVGIDKAKLLLAWCEYEFDCGKPAIEPIDRRRSAASLALD